MSSNPPVHQVCQHTAKDRDNRRLHRALPQSVCTRCGAVFTHHRGGQTTVERSR